MVVDKRACFFVSLCMHASHENTMRVERIINECKRAFDSNHGFKSVQDSVTIESIMTQ